MLGVMQDSRPDLEEVARQRAVLLDDRDHGDGEWCSPWPQWSIAGRIAVLQDAGKSWDEIADLLDLDPDSGPKWAMRIEQNPAIVEAARSILKEQSKS